MDDAQISTAAHLKERAAYYRTLARRAESDGIAREFYSMAEEYEEDAGRITDRVQASLLRRRSGSSRRLS
jgi:hypothetical protein